MIRLLLVSILFPLTILAQTKFLPTRDDLFRKEKEEIQAPELKSFAEATKWADIVAIAQVANIEYEQQRKINVKGYGFLDIHVGYKGTTKGEKIAVLAQGFDDNVCYYPDRENEGQRFLVFLKKAPSEHENVYYGFKPYCQLQILLSDLGHYILRTPLDNHVFEIDENLIEDQTFKDPHAKIDATLWTSTKREKFAEEYKCSIIESEDEFNKYFHLRYTQGVPIYNIRKLLNLEYKPRITSDQI